MPSLQMSMNSVNSTPLDTGNHRRNDGLDDNASVNLPTRLVNANTQELTVGNEVSSIIIGMWLCLASLPNAHKSKWSVFKLFCKCL